MTPRANPTKAAITFLLSFAILLLTMRVSINPYDEGIWILGGKRALVGEVPHRDFYANYGVGLFYSLAGLFKLFGSSLLVERLADITLQATFVTLMARFIATRSGERAAAAVALGCTALFVSDGVSTANIHVLILLVLTVWLLCDNWNNRRHLLLAGIATGLAATFRYDIGFFIMAAALLSIAVVSLRGQGSWPEKLKDGFISGFIYAAGVALIFVPVAVLFLVVSPAQPFIHDVIVFPSQFYALTRGLPLPTLQQCLSSISHAIAYLPILGAAVGLSAIAQPNISPTVKNTLITLVIFTLVLALKNVVRVSLSHGFMALAMTLLILGVAWPWRRQPQLTVKNKIWHSFVVIAVIITVILFGSQLSRRLRKEASYTVAAQWLQHKPKSDLCDASNQKLICFDIGQDRVQTIKWLRENTTPNEKIFIGTGRSDKIFVNEIMTYFISDRLPATHWHHYDPGLQNTLEIQQNIVRELKEQNVRTIITDNEWDDAYEPNDSAKSTGVTLLDEEIKRSYHPVQNYGSFTIWLLN